MHKFYLNKIGWGIIYFFTGGLFFIGWAIDLFTLGSQVDLYNALLLGGRGGVVNNTVYINNIVVNDPGYLPTAPGNAPAASHNPADPSGIESQNYLNYLKSKKGV